MMKPVLASSTGTGGDTVRRGFVHPTSSGAPTSGRTSMRRSNPPRERASAFICRGWTEDACRVSSKGSPKPTPPQPSVLVVLDGAPSHRSEEIVCPENVSFLGLPAYSPELDPVERWFQEFRRELSNPRPSRRSSYCKRRSAKRLYPTGRSLLAYDSSPVSPGGWRP